MNKNDIIKMALEAGCYSPDNPDDYAFSVKELYRFASLVADSEREEWQPLFKAAKGVLNWTEIAHRPPVKVDSLEIGRMVCVRLHALIYLDAAIRAKENT